MNPTLPEDLKRDIAHVVRSVDFHYGLPGGMCAPRTLVGHLLLKALDLEPRIAAGGMVYRAGPNPKRDVVAYCGQHNLGCFAYGQFLGHYWLTLGTAADEEVIDFSAGDWRSLWSAHDAEIPGVTPMGRIRFFRNPPEYIWASKRSLEPIAGHHTPMLGHAWFTGFRGTPPRGPLEVMEQLGEEAMLAIDQVLINGARRLRLWDRVRNYKSDFAATVESLPQVAR